MVSQSAYGMMAMNEAFRFEKGKHVSMTQNGESTEAQRSKDDQTLDDVIAQTKKVFSELNFENDANLRNIRASKRARS